MKQKFFPLLMPIIVCFFLLSSWAEGNEKASFYVNLGASYYKLGSYEEAVEQFHKALALDPAMAESHAVIADLLRFENRWSEAEEHYLAAIRLEPKNATGYLWYAEQLASVGKLELCLENALIALELDPFNAGTNSMAAFGYELVGDMDLARQQLVAAWDLGHPGAIYIMIEWDFTNGFTDRAQQLIEDNAEHFDDDDRRYFAELSEAVSQPDTVDVFLGSIANHPDSTPHFVAFVNVLFGRLEHGMRLYRENPITGNNWMELWLPAMQVLREHPQFQDLLETAGLPSYWDEYGWPSRCARDGETITCR